MNTDYRKLSQLVKQWGQEVGFCLVGITGPGTKEPAKNLQSWLDRNYHADMEFLQDNQQQRNNPSLLLPEIKSVIICALNYWPKATPATKTLQTPSKAYISRYALGRDYHKVVKKRLYKIAEKLAAVHNDCKYRCFTDSAPVFEKHFAINAGIGWQGKNSLILNNNEGSLFFLGAIYTNLPLMADKPMANKCGNCTRCIDNCPTKAIIRPHVIDARRCVAYLTIEHKGSIPPELRPLIGNRIYGCDDCQLACPWNRFAKTTDIPDFTIRNNLDAEDLITLFLWDENEFLAKTEGSAIRRIGHERWLRNIAIALGNCPPQKEIISALKSRLDHPSELVREHVKWTIENLGH